MKKFLIFLLFISSITTGQDTTRSQAFKNNQFIRPSIFKAKYPSYSLLAGYILVTEANRGDPFAQHELGIRYLIGKGFQADTVKAVYWLRRAVDQNLPSAKYNYGILLYNGIGVPWNPFEAYANFKSAASTGLSEALLAYGLLLTDNLTINRNYGEAYKQFVKAANADYEPAKEILSQLKKSGFIPPLEPLDELENYSQQIIDESPKLVSSDWDLDYFNFDNETEEDDQKKITRLLSNKGSDLKKFLGLEESNSKIIIPDTSGIGILKFAADNGSPEALLVMAKCYENGIVLEKKIINAAVNYLSAYRLGSYKAGESLYKLMQNEDFNKLLKDEAAKGEPDAMYVWAGISAIGYNNQISNNQALDFLNKAASKKHIQSIIELGLCYSSGSIVKKDFEKAIGYWQNAAQLGSREASIRIAFAQIADTLNQENVTASIELLLTAADEGSVLAQTFLGYCYEKGLGVGENKGLAARYYRHAAQRGNEIAANSLIRLYDEIRPLEEEFQIYKGE
ncbi:MAG: tetratricopeptide repeat protein [Bacteroidota bacterium]